MLETIVRASFKGQPNCLICNKPMENHSFEEAKACVAAEKARIADISCPSCERPFGEHSVEGMTACAHKQRDQK
jgi:uncharacterized protein with PIN domain